MTKDELWKFYVERNPQFGAKGNVTLSSWGIRKLFEQTWDRAHSVGFDNGRAWEQNQSKMRGGGEKSIFEQVFGDFGIDERK